MRHSKNRPFADYFSNPNRPYRSVHNAQVLGVCAGLAEHFGFEVGTVRALTLIGAFVFFPTVITGYCILGVLLQREPKDAPKRDKYDEEIRQQVRSEPQAVLNSQRHRFRALDRRLQRIEKYVTSSRFNLDREFENLKR